MKLYFSTTMMLAFATVDVVKSMSHQTPTEGMKMVDNISKKSVGGSKHGRMTTELGDEESYNFDGANVVEYVPEISFGDPHFATFDGTKYSFHGECDLVIAQNPTFLSGLGVEIHARTELVTDWSLISNAAVKIGTDIFELSNDGNIFFNGVETNDLTFKMAGKYTVTKVTERLGKATDVNAPVRVMYKINLDGDYIGLSVFKRMISIKASKKIESRGGMAGSVLTSGLVGRNGKTILNGPNEMGMQWQVNTSGETNDGTLFHQVRAPQYPTLCKLPAEAAVRKSRRLHESTDDLTALSACREVDESLKPFCITDVIQTGDVDVALNYAHGVAF